MASQVTYTNLFSESRNNVVDLITTTNVPDSTISSAEYRKRIYSREPGVKSSEFQGYPFLIVGPARVDTETLNQSLDMKHKFVNFEIVVEVRTSDVGYGSKDGQGLSDMDSISDALVKTFSDATNRLTLSRNTLAFCSVNTEGVETITVGNERIYRREVVLSFRKRMPVST